MNAQAGLIAALENKLPMNWLLQRIMHLSEDDANLITMQKSDEKEKDMDDQARMAFELQKKYPGIDVTGLAQAAEGGEPGQEQAMEDVQKELNKINLSIKENIQSNSRVVKKIEEIGPLAKQLKRTIDGRKNDNQRIFDRKSENR
jgi:hypothetical protein